LDASVIGLIGSIVAAVSVDSAVFAEASLRLADSQVFACFHRAVRCFMA
jgi:hypothetical protein